FSRLSCVLPLRFHLHFVLSPHRPLFSQSLSGEIRHHHPFPTRRSSDLNFPSGDENYHSVLAPVSRSYPDLTGRLPTCYSPVRRSFHKFHPEGINLLPALDLHVLGTPPAFVLSQDQTLQKSLR